MFETAWVILGRPRSLPREAPRLDSGAVKTGPARAVSRGGILISPETFLGRVPVHFGTGRRPSPISDALKRGQALCFGELGASPAVPLERIVRHEIGSRASA